MEIPQVNKSPGFTLVVALEVAIYPCLSLPQEWNFFCFDTFEFFQLDKLYILEFFYIFTIEDFTDFSFTDFLHLKRIPCKGQVKTIQIYHLVAWTSPDFGH